MYLKYFKAMSLLIGLFVITSCAEVVPYKHTSSTADAYLTVYRPDKFLVGGVSAQLKIDGQLIAKINAGEYVKVNISPENHTIATNGVGYNGDDMAIELSAKKNEEFILEINPNPAMWGVSLIPLFAAMSNPFIIKVTKKTDFTSNKSNLKEVSITYDANNALKSQ